MSLKCFVSNLFVFKVNSHVNKLQLRAYTIERESVWAHLRYFRCYKYLCQEL